MPQWQFVAFSTETAAKILTRVQQALRDRDLKAWQEVYAQLQKFYICKVSDWAYSSAPPKTYLYPIADGATEISATGVPPETVPVGSPIDAEIHPPLTRLLMDFLTAIARYRQESEMSKPFIWASPRGELAWERIYISDAEREEHQLLCREVFNCQRDFPEPFHLIRSRYVNSSYVAPEAVARLAAAERQTGLLRRVGDELEGEAGMIGRDLARLGLLIELAARERLALHYREDGT
jgi:hypothetical protein